jgi:RNase P/RNase MRP subunit p29
LLNLNFKIKDLKILYLKNKKANIQARANQVNLIDQIDNNNKIFNSSLIKRVKTVNNQISQKNHLIHGKILKANSESLKIKNKQKINQIANNNKIFNFSLIKKVKTVNNQISQNNRLIHGKMLKINLESIKIKDKDQIILNIIIKKEIIINSINSLTHNKIIKAKKVSNLVTPIIQEIQKKAHQKIHMINQRDRDIRNGKATIKIIRNNNKTRLGR